MTELNSILYQVAGPQLYLNVCGRYEYVIRLVVSVTSTHNSYITTHIFASNRPGIMPIVYTIGSQTCILITHLDFTLYHKTKGYFFLSIRYVFQRLT